MLPGRPLRHARADIGTLAWRDWAPRGQVRAMHGGCALGQAAGGALRVDVAFAVSGKTLLTLTSAGPGSRASPAGGQPQQIFPGALVPACVLTGGSEHPAAPPQRADRACGPAGGSNGGLGSGDRASLPGRSSRYRVIWLVCAQCGTKLAWLFYDERDMPLCADEQHGQMELQP